MQARVFCYFAGGSGVLNFNWHMQQWKEKVMCEIHLCNLKSHFRQDVYAYCTRPVSMHLMMVCVSCSFNSFSIFLLCFAQQQNLIKIMFFCIHFPVWLYPPQNNEKKIFLYCKLYWLTGMWTVSAQVSKSGTYRITKHNTNNNKLLFKNNMVLLKK